MKRLKMLAAIMLCAMSCSSLAEDRPIVPGPFKRAPSYEIGELLYKLMPQEGSAYIPWSHMANSGIVWMTEGYESSGDGAYRWGVIRVNILGEVSTELEHNLMELLWTITYVTPKVPSFGAQGALIRPGIAGEYSCFGSRYTMCSFNILPSLERSNANVQVICQSDSFRFPSAYRLTARGKSPLTVVVVSEGGSGGAQSEVYAFTETSKTDEELCAARYG